MRIKGIHLFIEGTEPTGVCYGAENKASEQDKAQDQQPKKWWENG